MSSLLTNKKLVIRVAWTYVIYVFLVLIAFAVGYFFLPRGVFLNTSWVTFGVMAASPETALGQYLATVAFNFGFVLFLGVGLNLQRVNGFPTGYIFIFGAAIVSGLIAGTNSFASQLVSPYSIEGWLVALRIQHLEMLGYTMVVSSTISIGLSEFTSWLPWKAKESKIKSWREIRFSQEEIIGFIIGVLLILIAAYNETMLGF